MKVDEDFLRRAKLIVEFLSTDFFTKEITLFERDSVRLYREPSELNVDIPPISCNVHLVNGSNGKCLHISGSYLILIGVDLDDKEMRYALFHELVEAYLMKVYGTDPSTHDNRHAKSVECAELYMRGLESKL